MMKQQRKGFSVTELPKQPEPMPYLTVVVGRKPEQKLHKRIADAKNAFDTPKRNPEVPKRTGSASGYTHGWGQIYGWNGHGWQLLIEVKQPTEADHRETKHKYGEYETRPWRLNN